MYVHHHITDLHEFGCLKYYVVYGSLDARGTCVGDYLCGVCCLFPVCKHVFLEGATFNKSVLTNITFVRPITCVSKHVCPEMARLSKLLESFHQYECACALSDYPLH